MALLEREVGDSQWRCLKVERRQGRSFLYLDGENIGTFVDAEAPADGRVGVISMDSNASFFGMVAARTDPRLFEHVYVFERKRAPQLLAYWRMARGQLRWTGEVGERMGSAMLWPSDNESSLEWRRSLPSSFMLSLELASNIIKTEKKSDELIPDMPDMPILPGDLHAGFRLTLEGVGDSLCYEILTDHDAMRSLVVNRNGSEVFKKEGAKASDDERRLNVLIENGTMKCYREKGLQWEEPLPSIPAYARWKLEVIGKGDSADKPVEITEIRVEEKSPLLDVPNSMAQR
jgi:hypothetical protein